MALVPTSDSAWNDQYAKLKEFKAEHGHCNVPQSNEALGMWVKHQRKMYTNKKLWPDQIKLLEAVDFPWNSDSAWNDQYVKLKEFKADHGHCNVPQSHKTLGRWVTHQRDKYRNEKLQLDRMKMLEGIGFSWNSFDKRWMDQFQQLVEFREKNGHCKVPQKKNVLGEWVKKQRELYKKKQLRQDRIKMLGAIGFCWDAKDIWELRFQQLVEFKEKNGHCKNPYNNRELGKWVRKQRDSYKKGKLRQDRIKMLEDIGFSWDPLFPPWDDRFQQLVKFKGENGHCKVPIKHEELGVWVRTQRQMYKTGKLSQERIDRLESIGFVWDVRKSSFSGKRICGESVNDSIWNDWYAKLQQYKAEHGHYSIPKNHDKLGNWVNRQRKAYMDGIMNPRRVEMLEKIGFRWEPKEAAWELWFQQLVAFKEKRGHCRVLRKDNHQLREWVSRQRELYKNEDLRLDRIEMLEGIGFSWNPLDERWDDQFQQLVEFKVENGHCNVTGCRGLAQWVNNQRQRYRSGKLLQERIDRLEGIGFVWDVANIQTGNSLDINEGVQKKGIWI